MNNAATLGRPIKTGPGNSGILKDAKKARLDNMGTGRKPDIQSQIGKPDYGPSAATMGKGLGLMFVGQVKKHTFSPDSFD